MLNIFHLYRVTVEVFHCECRATWLQNFNLPELDQTSYTSHTYSYSLLEVSYVNKNSCFVSLLNFHEDSDSTHEVSVL